MALNEEWYWPLAESGEYLNKGRKVFNFFILFNENDLNDGGSRKSTQE